MVFEGRDTAGKGGGGVYTRLYADEDHVSFRADGQNQFGLPVFKTALKGPRMRPEIVEFNPPPAMSNNGKPEPCSS